MLLAVGAIGCNVMDGLGPSATGVDALLSDARTALATGHPQRAVRLLETAYETDSTNVEVRVALSNALYAAQDLDVFTLRSAVERLNGKGTVPGPESSRKMVCTEGASPDRAPERFRAVPIGGDEALRRFANRQRLLHRVSRLLVDGVLARRPGAFAELPPEMQAKGYLLATLTGMGRHLGRVRTAVLETKTTLYLDTEAARSSLVACSPTPAARTLVNEALCRLQDDTQRALVWLRARNDQVGSDQTGVLIEPLRRHAEMLRGRSSCEPAAGARLADALPQDRLAE
jgi:hypothetical protein